MQIFLPTEAETSSRKLTCSTDVGVDSLEDPGLYLEFLGGIVIESNCCNAMIHLMYRPGRNS